MPTYQAGVAGPIPLEDGRVICAEQGPFELEVTTPHDAELVERGVIVPCAAEAVEPPVVHKATSPAVGATTAVAGEKE